MKPSQDGYTLTEMLVVIGIIGLIAAVLTPTLIGQMTRARAKAAQLQLRNVSAAVELFKDDVGRYPSSNDGLAALVQAPSGTEAWTGPYLQDRASLNDPWGAPILYTIDPAGHRYQVRSLGADSSPGGSGADRDIVYPPAP